MISEQEVGIIRKCIAQSHNGKAATAMRKLTEHAREYRGFIGGEMRTGVSGPEETGIYAIVGGDAASVVERDVLELRLLGIQLPDMPINDLCDALAQANDNDED